MKPNDKLALVYRSQCYLKVGNAAAALADAKMSFNDSIGFIRGLLSFAEALFSLGKFEMALIAFYRGHRVRKDMQSFRRGIEKCRDAILSAVRDPAATQIEDFEAIILKIEEMKAVENGSNHFNK